MTSSWKLPTAFLETSGNISLYPTLTESNAHPWAYLHGLEDAVLTLTNDFVFLEPKPMKAESDRGKCLRRDLRYSYQTLRENRWQMIKTIDVKSQHLICDLFQHPILLPSITVLLEKAMAPRSSTLAGKPHGRRSLVGCSPWGR